MTLTFTEYQAQAKETDQKEHDDDNGLFIALSGLVGEAGSLLTEYKKRLRDGDAHRGFTEHVGEELGDLLWYLATIATRTGHPLEDIARNNITKTRARWLLPETPTPLFDEDREPAEQLPRTFEYRYERRMIEGKEKVVLVDEHDQPVGNPLTDNSHTDDGYRFHDVLHLAHAVALGWSPVLRKMLHRKRKSNDAVDHVDENEDGARAAIDEELVVAAAYNYASDHAFLEGVEHVDWDLLRLIVRTVSRYEVKVRTEAEWEQALLLAFRVWREVRKHGGGTLRGDLRARTLEFVAPTRAR